MNLAIPFRKGILELFPSVKRATVAALGALTCATVFLPTISRAQQQPAAGQALKPAVYAVAFSADGKKLAVGTNGEALLYDTATWSVTDTCTKVVDAVRCFAFHPDGKHLAIGSGAAGVSGNLYMWDTSDPTHGVNYQPGDDTIESIAFSADGRNMLTAAFDSKARYYAVAFYPYTPQKLEEHNGRVTAVGFSSKPKYIYLTGAMDKMVKIWDYKTNKVVVNFDQATAPITGAAFLSNGEQIVASSMDGNLYWWGVAYNERRRFYSGYGIRAIKVHEDGVTAFGTSSDLKRIITAGADLKVAVRRMDDGGLIREFKGATAPVYGVALSTDGKMAAACGREGVVWVWDVEANKLLTTITPPGLMAPKQPAATTTILATVKVTAPTQAKPTK